MSKDKVRKGFGFYFMMLIMLLVAAFLIIVTIMLFSPNKPILGYKYFSYSDSFDVTKTTSGEIDINISSKTEIKIDATFAEVNFVRYDPAADKDKTDAVKIVNNAKGFAKAKSNTIFSYKVESVGNKLNVSVVEPKGFLYFSKNVSITIYTRENLSKAKVSIVTKNGNVTIGGSDVVTKGGSANLNHFFSIQSLSATTTEGNILINNNNNIKSFSKSLSLITESGKISSDIASVGDILSDIKLKTIRGKVSFDGLSCRVLNLDMTKGNCDIEVVNGDVKLICDSAVINIAKINGSFDTNNASNIGSSNITLGTVNGDVSIPYGGKANIKIKETFNNHCLINTTSGSVTFANVSDGGKAYYVETETGSINMNVKAAVSTSKFNLLSTSGTINLNVDPLLKGKFNLKSKGNINFNFASTSQFKLLLENFSGEKIKKLSDTVTISYVDNTTYAYPYYVNDYKDDTNIVTINGGAGIAVGLVGSVKQA